MYAVQIIYAYISLCPYFISVSPTKILYFIFFIRVRNTCVTHLCHSSFVRLDLISWGQLPWIFLYPPATLHRLRHFWIFFSAQYYKTPKPDFLLSYEKSSVISVKSRGTPQRGCRAGAPPNPWKPKFKKHVFCRYYDIKSFTRFLLQLKAATEIGWWPVH
jgi:hypothetical protein